MWFSQPCEQWHVASEGSQTCSSSIFIHFNACFKADLAHMWRKCVKRFPYVWFHWSEQSFTGLPQMCYPCPFQMLQSSCNKWDCSFWQGGGKKKKVNKYKETEEGEQKVSSCKKKLLGDFSILFRWILGLKNPERFEKVTLRRLRTTENCKCMCSVWDQQAFFSSWFSHCWWPQPKNLQRCCLWIMMFQYWFCP